MQYIHDLIEAQVERSPQAVALICDNDQLTYRALARRANQLARYLQNSGVGREALVGVCGGRSVETVVALLAVLKAGGGYVPLDPTYPRERLSFILSDAQVQIVVTQKEYAELFLNMGVQVVCIDSDWHRIAVELDTVPDTLASADSLAAVFYTSGSTGQPKGVMLKHENLFHFARLAALAHEVTGSDVYLQSAPIVYVVSIRQMWVPLTRGATVVITNLEQMHDPRKLFQLIKFRAITLMDIIPSFWRLCIQQLCDLPERERTELLDNSLRRIVSVGEALMSDIPHEWNAGFGHKAQLMNNFGQTEATGMVATYAIPGDLGSNEGMVPIGVPISETRLYILDADLRIVPAGETGELYISSPCLARGYLNRPELTAATFIPNPFEDGLSERLYRTGDLGRMREDGAIEFMGRTDHQVKIRGQRLELGEVEAVLRGHVAVRECAALVQGEREDTLLAAYVVARDKSLSASELRQYMHKLLPDYMVPSAIVFLEEMPRTASGKIDRFVLPHASVALHTPADASNRAEPRNHIERTLKAIWKDLLKLEDIGIHDSFFEVGGHSMLSVRMFARIERDLGVRLPYTSLFSATTIAQIAELVAGANEEVTRWRIVVPVATRGDKPPFFGVHALDGGVLFWRDIVSHLPADQPFYAIQAQGVDGHGKPLNRIPEMARLYIQEMRKVQPHGPYYLAGYSLGGEIAFEMGQQLAKTGEKVELLVMLDTRNPTRSIRPMTREGGSLSARLDAPPPSNWKNVAQRKVKGHYLRLSMLSPKQQAAYLLNQITVRVTRFRVAVIVKVYQLLRRRLPDRVLQQYLRKQHSEALANYLPTVYPGRITLFRASETLPTNPDDSSLGWGPLAAGGMEVYHFEGTHAIVYGEYAREVAGKLNECLERARSKEGQWQP